MRVHYYDHWRPSTFVAVVRNGPLASGAAAVEHSAQPRSSGSTTFGRSDVGQPPLRTRRLQWRSRPQTTHCTVSRFFPRDSGAHPSAEPGHLPLSRSRARKLHRPATRPRAYASAHAPASRQLRPGQAKKDFCCKSVAIFFKVLLTFCLIWTTRTKGSLGGRGRGDQENPQ